MTIDLDLDYSGYTYDQYSNSYPNALDTQQTPFHKTILEEKPSLNFSRTATHRGCYTTCEQRTDNVYMQAVGGRVPNWDIEIKIEGRWGDGDGIKLKGSATGDLYDNDGNSVHGKVEQEGNGRGRYEISVRESNKEHKGRK